MSLFVSLARKDLIFLLELLVTLANGAVVWLQHSFECIDHFG